MKMYIARDKKGDRLTLHSESPIWFEDFRVWGKGYMADLPRREYPEVTFENSPQEVELKLIEK
jgi:hypothetical protein